MPRIPTDAEQEARWAEFRRIADPASPDFVPYFHRPQNRPTWDAVKNLVDGFGTHLICPRRECGRAGCCRDEDGRDLPFCFRLHRGPLRFLILIAAKRHGLNPAMPGSLQRDEPDEAPSPRRVRGPSLLARLAAKGLDLDRLRRPADADPDDEWDWEKEPGAVALFRELTGDGGGARAPGRARPPG